MSSTREKAAEPLEADVLARRMRENHERVAVPINSASKKLHGLDEDGDVLCNSGIDRSAGNLVRKDVDVYPPGWQCWCRECVAAQLGVRTSSLPEEVRSRG